MRRLHYWHQGAISAINGSNFSMNPYAPGPGIKDIYTSRINDNRALDWSRGYWWALKNRPIKNPLEVSSKSA